MAHMKILIEMPSTTSHDETTLILILSFIFKLILKQKILSLYDEETDKDRGTDWISFFFFAIRFCQCWAAASWTGQPLTDFYLWEVKSRRRGGEEEVDLKFKHAQYNLK